jgi:hypothetical protein
MIRLSEVPMQATIATEVFDVDCQVEMIREKRNTARYATTAPIMPRDTPPNAGKTHGLDPEISKPDLSPPSRLLLHLTCLVEATAVGQTSTPILILCKHRSSIGIQMCLGYLDQLKNPWGT